MANRAGTDGGLHFFGQSFVAGPTGRVIARAAEDDEALLVTAIDPADIDHARRHIPFLRDLRGDLYEARWPEPGHAPRERPSRS